MMPRLPKNPIDPTTGQRRRGRPPKNPPIDTMQGAQSEEKAVGRAEVRSVDDREDIKRSTETGRLWAERMRGTNQLEPPDEIKRRYPDGQFAWAHNSKEGISMYRSKFGYEVAQSATPLPGQTDNTFVFKELVLMVRPEELKRVHDEVRREARQQASGDPEGHASAAEQEAYRQVRSDGGRPGDVRFFEQDDTITPAMQRTMTEAEIRDRIESDQRRAAVKGAAGRKSKYVRGGIPT